MQIKLTLETASGDIKQTKVIETLDYQNDATLCKAVSSFRDQASELSSVMEEEMHFDSAYVELKVVNAPYCLTGEVKRHFNLT